MQHMGDFSFVLNFITQYCICNTSREGFHGTSSQMGHKVSISFNYIKVINYVLIYAVYGLKQKLQCILLPG